jgi:phage shock protein B
VDAAIVVTIVLSLLVFLVPVLVIGLILWFVLSLVRNGGRSRESSAQEREVVQQIFTGLERMEKRVETLETILLEREKARGERSGQTRETNERV